MTLTAQLTAAAAVPLSAIAGGRIGGIIATATNPDWIGPLLGPLGALAFAGTAYIADITPPEPSLI